MLGHKPLLNRVADDGIKTFISTGMATLEEIDFAVNIFTKKNCDFELMHCNSTYPMREEDANLLCIPMLRDRYNCDVGYSGHESSLIKISIAAVTLGATSIERHITLDRTMYGSDQAASLEFNGMKTLSGSLKKMAIAYGENKLGNITEEEKIIAKKLRSHISE